MGTKSNGKRRRLERITHPTIVSPALFGWSYGVWILAVYAALFRSDVAPTTELIVGWFLSLTAGHLALFGFLLVAKKVWWGSPWAVRHPSVALLTIVLGVLIGVGAGNTVVSMWGGSHNSLLAGVDYVPLGILTLIFLGSLLDIVREHREKVAALRANASALNSAIHLSQHLLETEKKATLDKVDAALIGVRDALLNPSWRSAEVLRDASDTILRPLSHRLRSSAPDAEALPPRLPPPRFGEVLSELSKKPLLAPGATAAAVAFFFFRLSVTDTRDTPPSIPLNNGGSGLAISIDVASFLASVGQLGAVAVWTWLAAWSVALFTQKIIPPLRPRLRWLVIVGRSFFVAGAALVLIALTFWATGADLSMDLSPLFILLVFLSVQTATLVLGVARGFRLALHDVESQVSALEQELRRELSVANQRLTSLRTNLAFSIHGAVRGVLLAGAAQLEKAGSSPAEITRTQLLARIDEARALVSGDGEPIEFVQSLENLAKLWEGTCTISWSMAPDTQELLADNNLASRTASLIAEEACANALAHAHPTSITIAVACKNHNIAITVRNDLNRVAPIGESGLGTSLLNELALEWSLQSDDTSQTLHAVFPLSRKTEATTDTYSGP